MSKIFRLLIMCLLAAVTCAQAATPSQPAFRTVDFKAGFPWTEGLALVFKLDEKQCRQSYGVQWRGLCAAALGRPGSTAKNVRLSPGADGFWQWDDQATLVFRPANGKSLKPDTTYTVDLASLNFPSFIKLNRTSVSTRTMPEGVRLLTSEFLIDPSPAGRHRISASFQFDYPVAEDYKIALKAPEAAVFGAPEMVWSENRDRLNISFPVSRLPASPTQATFIFPHMGQIVLMDGTARYFPADQQAGGTVFKQNMPGNSTLFKVSGATLKSQLNEKLDRDFLLELNTSLYASPEAILKNLVALELPEYNSPGAAIPYNWEAAPEIPAGIIKKSRLLRISSLQKDELARSRFQFTINPTPGRYVFVSLQGDIRAASGQKLPRPWFKIMAARGGDADLGFLQPGNILPLPRSGILDIFATGLDEIAWEARIVEKPFLALLAASSSNAFKYPLANAGIGMDTISVGRKGTLKPSGNSGGSAQFTALDLGSVFKNEAGKGENPTGLVQVRLTGLKNGKEKAWATRLVLASGLGILVKRTAMGELDCFVNRFKDGQPAGSAKISILGANGVPVAGGEADASGFLRLPPLAALQRESTPMAVVASLDGDMGWLPLNDRNRELNYSEFSIAGSHASAEDLIVCVFGERGIYRPGEKLNFGCITRKGDFAAVDASLPMFAEIIDPRGIKVWERSFQAGQNGLATLDWTCPATALSGMYILNVRAAAKGAILGSGTARVEDFQPDTLKIKIDAPYISGWLPVNEKNPAGCSIDVGLQNLYGTPAAGNKIKPVVETAPAVFAFKGFESYIFTDSAPFIGQGTRRNLPECQTDAAGQAAFSVPAELLARASARVTVIAEGFDSAGGRPTIGSSVFLSSPMRRILGYRPVGALTNLNFIPAGSKASLEFIALEPDLTPVAWENLRFSLNRRQFVTSLVSDGSGGYRYDETPATFPLREWTENLSAKGLKIDLDTGTPGEYLLLVKDDEDRIVAQTAFAVAGNSLAAPDSPLAVAKMRMRLDKNAYEAGEKINVAMSLPYAGFGLLSIERDGVEAYKFFEAKAGDCVQSIAIPEGFEGKGYIVASFARSIDSDAIYMSPHTFAVAPFTANIKVRDLGLSIKAPAKALPGQQLEIAFSGKEKGFAVISAVDVGILQLTGFNLPSPLATLLGDRALDVKTIQAYDLMMPDHNRLAPRLSAYGGGREGSPFGARFENPFKRRHEPPIAFWSGILPVDSEISTIKIPLPDYYNGRIKIMAVGISASAAGSASAETIVKGPVVATPGLPPAVSPGDHFEASLLLANNTGQDLPVRISMSVPDSLKILSDLAKEATIPANGEILLPFTLKARELPCSSTIDFAVHGGKIELKRQGFISVRPPATLLTTLEGGMATKTRDLPPGRPVFAEKAMSIATVASVPVPLASGFAQYLSVYPHGCTEQLVSRAFAQILMRSWPVQGIDEQKRKKLLEHTLTAIRERFNGQGVALWPGGEANTLLTAYAADFLLAMREAGLNGSDELLGMLCDALAGNCQLNEPTLEAARTSAYAIWVLTREGRITTQLLEELQQGLKDHGIHDWVRDITAVFIAASRAEMHMKAILPENIVYTPAGWFDEYAQYSLHMAILARYFPAKCTDSAKKGFYEATALSMNSGSYATFAACQGIRAIMAMAAAASPAIMQARLACPDEAASGEGKLLAGGAIYSYTTTICPHYQLVMPESDAPVFWQVATEGYGQKMPEENIAAGIEVRREYLNSAGEVAQEAKVGEEITVRLTIRGMQPEIGDCVITDLLPGGFEMIIPRGGGSGEARPVGIQFIDRTEDRMLIFADLGTVPLVYSYKIRAVARGSFLAPATSAESMYNRAIYGTGTNINFEVVK